MCVGWRKAAIEFAPPPFFHQTKYNTESMIKFYYICLALISGTATVKGLLLFFYFLSCLFVLFVCLFVFLTLGNEE
jgi:hypothetical protein